MVTLEIEAVSREAAEAWVLEHGYLLQADDRDQAAPPAARPLPRFAGPDAVERSLESAARLVTLVMWLFEFLYFGFFFWVVLVWFHAIWMACQWIAAKGGSPQGPTTASSYVPSYSPPPPTPSVPAGPSPSAGEVVGNAAMVTIEAVMLILMILGAWLIAPLVVYALGRAIAAALRSLADQLRLAKRAAGLPYASTISG